MFTIYKVPFIKCALCGRRPEVDFDVGAANRRSRGTSQPIGMYLYPSYSLHSEDEAIKVL
jgi:hypothetical protein